MKYKKNDLLEISWIDSFTLLNEWVDVKALRKKDPCLIHSVGYFVHQSRQCLIIARGRQQGRINGVFYIPMGCVKKIRKVKR
jgi:hypothetical protein